MLALSTKTSFGICDVAASSFEYVLTIICRIVASATSCSFMSLLERDAHVRAKTHKLDSALLHVKNQPENVTQATELSCSTEDFPPKRARETHIVDQQLLCVPKCPRSLRSWFRSEPNWECTKGDSSSTNGGSICKNSTKQYKTVLSVARCVDLQNRGFNYGFIHENDGLTTTNC